MTMRPSYTEQDRPVEATPFDEFARRTIEDRSHLVHSPQLAQRFLDLKECRRPASRAVLDQLPFEQ
jgi:hypothetical protein